MNQAAERIESLKAALTGAIAATLVSLATVSSNAWIRNRLTNDDTWLSQLLDWSTLLHLGVASISGFLFGVTYRYIVRQDQNFQLKSGAVLAFSLVRCLPQLETKLDYGSFSLGLLESLLLFGIVALILNRLMQRGWIKPFAA
ncbi:MAG: hypothetical protein EDM05_59435 [Leptolyngbya sp. IPPAS B-1204]|nr:hypothetical protein [Elainella sp. C42_A2020_010]RNJ65146.1 MAG: hypothetical protein EDM05_32660 [Leptolyngbya sp. IPPAS B-1204]